MCTYHLVLQKTKETNPYCKQKLDFFITLTDCFCFCHRTHFHWNTLERLQQPSCVYVLCGHKFPMWVEAKSHADINNKQTIVWSHQFYWTPSHHSLMNIIRDLQRPEGTVYMQHTVCAHCLFGYATSVSLLVHRFAKAKCVLFPPPTCFNPSVAVFWARLCNN